MALEGGVDYPPSNRPVSFAVGHVTRAWTHMRIEELRNGQGGIA